MEYESYLPRACPKLSETIHYVFFLDGSSSM